MRLRIPILPICLLPVLCGTSGELPADDFDSVLVPLFAQRCEKCHGEHEANGDVNFRATTSSGAFAQGPELIRRTLDALDSHAMPPETEPELDAATRQSAIAVLKAMLQEATASAAPQPLQLRRLNRFQYNNSVRDLFRLNRDVFALPEKLMTRYGDFPHVATDNGASGVMPDVVQVASHALNPGDGLRDVKPYPRDLRAEHGFDNQADQLTLSPLLLDAFLQLSVSIVESPDFNEQTVGIWDSFFAEPADGLDQDAEIRARIAAFLRVAFRGPVADEVLNRYADYAVARRHQGLSFPACMKKVAAAALSSPLFLLRAPSVDVNDRPFELASDLAYFLWGSCPDDELLRLAAGGELAQPDVLDRTITRMMTDARIERFLDSFPAQWMQLENLLAVTPDPQVSPYFRVDPATPASVQMVLEPLLLFDTVFFENRPLIDLIAPDFSYQSDFLQTWYTSDLSPPAVDVSAILAENQRLDEQRRAVRAAIAEAREQLHDLLDPVRSRLRDAHVSSGRLPDPVDLKPFAAWEFDGDLRDAVRGLDLVAHGDVAFRDGLVILNRTYLLSQPLPVELHAKTLEVWCRLTELDQPGGGLMGIQGPGDFFDTIVIGERNNRHWISGSEGFRRTEDFAESTEETAIDETIHLVMVYRDDGTTLLYRNGRPYGQPFQKERATFPAEQSSVIFGLRHLPPIGNRFLSVSLDAARLYNRALTADEVAASFGGRGVVITDAELTAALTTAQKGTRDELTACVAQAEAALREIPRNRDPNQVVQEVQREFEAELRRKLQSRTFRRVPAEDPRYGGIITNAAILSMTSGPNRTHPVARGVWMIEVIFNDPPAPPPNDVPPLNEDAADQNLTIREQFAAHRENPSCAGCHAKLDPLGFALENFDITGRWRDRYDNGREVDPGGTLMRQYEFHDVMQFKAALVREQRRFARAFTEHLLRFALARELTAADAVTVEAIVDNTEPDQFRLRSLIREVAVSRSFLSQPAETHVPED